MNVRGRRRVQANVDATIRSMRRIAFALLPVALAACGRRKLLTEKPNPGAIPDAAVAAAPPDATEIPPDAAPPDAMPASITFDRAPWQPGQVVKVWRKTTLTDSRGSATVDDGFALSITVASVSGGDVIGSTGPDCVVRFGGGTVKVTGACEGNDTDVAYKLDLFAQLLAVPRGTARAGDRADGFVRPLAALFRLQDANATLASHLATVDGHGVAIYGVHADVDGTMLKSGLHVTASLDGEIHVDAHATTMTGTLGPAKARITGWPIADYHSTGTLQMSFGIEPAAH